MMNRENQIDPWSQMAFEFGGKPAYLLSVNEIYASANQDLLTELKEDVRIERKPPGYHPKSLGDYFSMFANTVPDGGVIIVGMEDSGAVTGCSSLTSDQLNNLERAGLIYCPDAKHKIKKVRAINVSGQEDFLLVIQIDYHPKKLVRTVAGDAFYRRGESKHKYTPEQAREVEIDKGQIDLELEPCKYQYPSEFDLELIEQFASNYRKNRELREPLANEEILELTHLGKIDGAGFEPNTACALLFANDVTRDFPGCKIRFFRFEGEHEGTGKEWNPSKDIWIDSGPIPRQIVDAEKIIDQQVREFTRLESDQKFYTAPEYPKTAWYEALVNACVHRSYNLRHMNIFVKMFDDRLVIESPGGFPALVTPENIYEIHHPRNPHLMQAMYYLSFVRCAREGTRRIRDSMLKMDLPHPEFSQKEVSHAQVEVTLRNNIKHRRVYIDTDAIQLVGKTIFDILTEDERRAINFIAEYHKVNVSEVQRLSGRSWRYSKNLLERLTKIGILTHVRRKGVDRDPDAHYILRTNSQSENLD